MSVFQRVIARSEKITGLTVEQIRAFSPERFREYIETKNGKKMAYISEFPVIGRGNVLRDSFISHDSLDEEIDDILSRT